MKTKLIAFMLIIAAMLMFAGCGVAQDKSDSEILKMNDDCRFEYLGIEEHPYVDECFQYW